MKISLAGSLSDLGIDAAISRWEDNALMARMWQKDATVWFDEPTDEISDRLGWLDLPEASQSELRRIDMLAKDAHAAHISTVVLCGMGGSSLAPEVFAASLPVAGGFPKLIVVDSTHPDAIADVSGMIDLDSTWFIVASKSGGTLETHAFMEFFWAQMADRTDSPGDHFIAITDPGSGLAGIGSDRGFREVFLANPNVGGRYSALTHFGLVPAGLIGGDTSALLSSARAAEAMCGPDTPLPHNPGMMIGAAMAAAAAVGRDKTRFVGSGPGTHFGVWAEQLIAESTGKSGTGIVPIDHGPPRPGATDELVISFGTDAPEDAEVNVEFSDPHDIGGAMFIMEVATAVAGEILGIHPFNQPDVQRAKELAAEAIDGSLRSTTDPIPLDHTDLALRLDDLLDGGGSYVSIQAYVNPTTEASGALDDLRTGIATRTDLATTVGFGPRFLHSTGQLHKGGPPGGLFIQLVDEPSRTLDVPDAGFTFNQLVVGQAAGDRQALIDADRKLVSIDLGSEPVRGIAAITELVGATR